MGITFITVQQWIVCSHKSPCLSFQHNPTLHDGPGLKCQRYDIVSYTRRLSLYQKHWVRVHIPPVWSPYMAVLRCNEKPQTAQIMLHATSLTKHESLIRLAYSLTSICHLPFIGPACYEIK
jgi:hypothetical protein